MKASGGQKMTGKGFVFPKDEKAYRKTNKLTANVAYPYRKVLTEKKSDTIFAKNGPFLNSRRLLAFKIESGRKFFSWYIFLPADKVFLRPENDIFCISTKFPAGSRLSALPGEPFRAVVRLFRILNGYGQTRGTSATRPSAHMGTTQGH